MDLPAQFAALARKGLNFMDCTVEFCRLTILSHYDDETLGSLYWIGAQLLPPSWPSRHSRTSLKGRHAQVSRGHILLIQTTAESRAQPVTTPINSTWPPTGRLEASAASEPGPEEGSWSSLKSLSRSVRWWHCPLPWESSSSLRDTLWSNQKFCLQSCQPHQVCLTHYHFKLPLWILCFSLDYVQLYNFFSSPQSVHPVIIIPHWSHGAISTSSQCCDNTADHLGTSSAWASWA